MKIHIKENDANQPIVQEIPNNLVVEEIKKFLLKEFTTISKDNIELLINDLNQALDQFGYFHFLHIHSSRGESVDIIF